MDSKITNERSGYVFATVGGIVLSFDTVLLRIINLPPIQIAFWRAIALALPVICLIIYASLRHKKLPEKDSLLSKDMLLSAFFYGLSSVLFPVSAMMTSIANMLFIISTAPLWAGILGWIFLREPVSRVTFFSFITALVGVFIVVYNPGKSFSFHISVGDVTAFLTAVTMAAAFVTGRGSKRNLSLSPSVGAVMSAVILYLCFDINLRITAHTFSLILLEGSIVVFIALSLIAKSSRLIPSAHLGLFLLLETIFGPIWIYFIFREFPGYNAIVGGSVILLALLANSIYSVWLLRRYECE